MTKPNQIKRHKNERSLLKALESYFDSDEKFQISDHEKMDNFGTFCKTYYALITSTETQLQYNLAIDRVIRFGKIKKQLTQQKEQKKQ